MLPLGTRARLLAYQALERLSDLRGSQVRPMVAIDAGAPQPAWWAFVSTIGELNATAPLLEAVRARLPQLRMVLVTDHAHYVDSYRRRFPDAEVIVSLGHSQDAKALAAARPPRLTLVAEIPLLPGDAPCRCSSALLLEAKRRGSRLLVVNGWLYGYAPASRMDHLERRLLGQSLLQAVDVFCVQTGAIRDRLVGEGIAPSRVHVVGNLKLDVLRGPPPASGRALPPGLEPLLAGAGPVIVAGSLTQETEQDLLLDAFIDLRRRRGGGLLVLAPRHPEVQANLDALDAAMQRRGLRALRRSEPVPPATAFDVLVLDTMGELRDFYAAADVAHVGVDHNVLEPLGIGKTTTVSGGWNPTYPSYPIYRALSDAGLLCEAQTPAALADAWADALDGRLACTLEPARRVLTSGPSSLQSHLDILARMAALDPA